MFLALHRPRTGDIAPGAITEAPYLVWSVIAQGPSFSADISQMNTELMKEEAISMIRVWSSFYEKTIEKTDPRTVQAFDFVYPGSMVPWPQSRIALIGDAVHPMPPTAGAGASTAIVDALTLVDKLSSESWPMALEGYRDRMFEDAPKAVEKARPALVWQVRLANPVLRWLALTIGLPIVDIALRVLNRT